MNIYFNEIFKELRRKMELTQEQAADIFCVSPQAVSRWETGASCPDISLLPAIAEFFGVSIESLLGVENAKRKERHNDYQARFDDAMNQGNIRVAKSVAREAVKDFPNDWAMLNNLMYALFVLGDDSDKEIIDIGERILRYCTDDRIRLEAKARLGFHYCETGRKDKGRAIFESLPRENDCREGKLYWALDGEERLSFLRQRVLDGLYLLTWAIDAYAHKSENATDEQRIALQNKRIELFIAVFENGDYGDCHYALAKTYETLARLYLNTGDSDAALSCLQKCAGHAKAFDTLPEEFIHTSPLIDGLTVRRSERQTADSRSLCQIMKEDVFGDKRFDALRGDGCFISALKAIG